MAAFTELVAANGLADVAVADVVAHAAVSRSVFYSCFSDLAALGQASYERFIEVLIARITAGSEAAADWSEFFAGSVRGYLGALQEDLVVARTFLIETDAAGRVGRARRLRSMTTIADRFARRYEQERQRDPTLGPLSPDIHLGMVHAVRQLAYHALDQDDRPDLLEITDVVTDWMTTTIAGARARDAAGSSEPRVRRGHQRPAW